MKFERIYFDTNFYRELTQNIEPVQIKSRFSHLAKVGLKKNIDSHIHIYVIYELLSHLSSNSDPHFLNCKNAILAINHHCRDSKTKEFKYINDFDSELIKYFFNKNRDKTDEVYNICSKLCDYIIYNQNDYYLEDIRQELKAFTSTVADMKGDFINYYKSLIYKIDPSVIGWRLNKDDKSMRRKNLDFLKSDEFLNILAREEVHRLSKYANVNPTEKDILKFTKFINDNFSFPLFIKIEILRRINGSGLDLSKKNRGNWFWDIQIASCVYTDNNLNIIPYIFVTSDKGILKIAKKYGLNKRVISKQDYINLLQIDSNFLN